MENLIYHYTSFETLIHILASPHLYATQVFFMNDREEMFFLRKECQEIVEGLCNAPRLSRAALRRSSQKMRISFSDRLLRRPILSYAAEALNHLSYS